MDIRFRGLKLHRQDQGTIYVDRLILLLQYGIKEYMKIVRKIRIIALQWV